MFVKLDRGQIINVNQIVCADPTQEPTGELVVTFADQSRCVYSGDDASKVWSLLSGMASEIECNTRNTLEIPAERTAMIAEAIAAKPKCDTESTRGYAEPRKIIATFWHTKLKDFIDVYNDGVSGWRTGGTGINGSLLKYLYRTGHLCIEVAPGSSDIPATPTKTE